MCAGAATLNVQIIRKLEQQIRNLISCTLTKQAKPPNATLCQRFNLQERCVVCFSIAVCSMQQAMPQGSTRGYGPSCEEKANKRQGFGAEFRPDSDLLATKTGNNIDTLCKKARCQRTIPNKVIYQALEEDTGRGRVREADIKEATERTR